MNAPGKSSSHITALVACVFFYIVGVGGYAVYNADQAQKEALRTIDTRLALAARSLKYMLAPDFHDRATAPDSIEMPEIDRNRIAVSNFAKETEFTYLYTVIKSGEKYYFGAPTVTEEELKQKRSWYFHPYEDIPPEFVKAFETNKAVYVNYHDQWGHFRSIALPENAPGGTRYLACADYDITFLAGLKQDIYLKSTLTGIFFLVLSLPFIILFRRVDKDYTRELLEINAELDDHRLHLEKQVERRTMDLVKAKEEAEQANRMKSVFLSNTSHELRTPLCGILGYAERIVERRDPEQDVKHANIILRQAEHMLELVNELLDHARIVAGRVMLNPQPFEFSELLDVVAQTVMPLARKKKLEFILDHDMANNLWLTGDALLIKKILINLLGNAVKFTGSGHVILRVKQVDRKELQLKLRFSVEDTGPGIPADKIPLLFERFVQLSDSETNQIKGSGLGLAIAQQLVEQMDGRIQVQSDYPQGGSRFWFDLALPLTQPPKAPAITSDLRSGETARGNILLVEDDQTNQTLLSLQIREAGHGVDLAETGGKAISLAAGRKYDLILMDLNLPDMTGLEACRRILGGGGLNQDTPVVALTATTDRHTQDDCRAIGIKHVEYKPVRRRQLLKTINTWLTRTPANEPGAEQVPPGPLAADQGAVEPDPTPVMEWDETLHEFSDDADLLISVVEQFCEESAGSVRKMRTAVREGQPGRVSDLAHAVKGGAANLGAVRLQTLAGQAEALGMNKNLEEVMQIADQMGRELERLAVYIQKKAKVAES